jgi:hypothetical protein
MIYESGDVTVDSHFARFGSKSYAIDKINSVDVREETKSGCLWIGFAILTGFFGLGAVGSLSSGSGSDIGTMWVIVAVLAGITLLLYKQRPKPVYHLMLATSSGEVQATNSGDREAVLKLRAAIEAAMSAKA